MALKGLKAVKAAGAALTGAGATLMGAGAGGGGRAKVSGAGAGLKNCLDCLGLFCFLLTTLLLPTPWPPAATLFRTTCRPLRPTLTT